MLTRVRVMRAIATWTAALCAGLTAANAGAQDAVDLLHAVPSTVVVSSAYRGEGRQVARLVDGDTETAWNSATDDLAGAWIEVRVPDDATVSEIRMTVGFTHTGPRGEDLFVQNARVTEVHVEHGDAVTRHELDPDVREPQALAVAGGGGTYRLVMTGVVPGDNEAWREVCVSDLRVLGAAPGARAGAHTPRLRVARPRAPGRGGVYVASDHSGAARIRGGRLDELVRGGDHFYDLEATASGRVFALMDEGVHELRDGGWAAAPPLPARARPQSMAVEGAEGLLLLTSRGLFRLDGETWAPVEVRGLRPERQPRRLAVDGRGRTWVLHPTRGVFRILGGALHAEPIPGARGRFEHLAVGRDGTVAVTQRVTAHRWRAGEWRTVTRPFGASAIRAVAVQPDGTVLLGGDAGVVRFGDAGDPTPIPLPSRRMTPVYLLACDERGNVWAGASGGLLALSSTYRFLRFFGGGYAAGVDGTASALTVRGRGPFH